MSEIKVRRTNAAGAVDLTQLIQAITWSGGTTQCARALDITVPTSTVDKALPAVPIAKGNLIEFAVDGTQRFSGNVFTSQKSSDSSLITYSCADRGFYLKRNSASYKFKGSTPEAAARKVCADFGIKVGSLAATGFALTRSFAGVPLYQIIMTGYTLAAQKNGKAYALRFVGDALSIIAKEPTSETPVLAPGGNLLTVSVSESVENMINQVVIEDSTGKRIAVKKDADAIAAYGLMQSVIRQASGKDSTAEAEALIRDNGETQKITVTNLGDIRMLSDACVIVRDPATGLRGLFWIETDMHTWKNNLYQNKLTLNFRKIMDSQTAGSEE